MMGKSKLKVKGAGKVLDIKKDYIVIGEVLTIHATLYPGLVLDKMLDKELKQEGEVKVLKGQILTNGALDIRQYQDIKGDLEAQRYIVREVKKSILSKHKRSTISIWKLLLNNFFQDIDSKCRR